MATEVRALLTMRSIGRSRLEVCTQSTPHSGMKYRSVLRGTRANLPSIIAGDSLYDLSCLCEFESPKLTHYMLVENTQRDAKTHSDI